MHHLNRRWEQQSRSANLTLWNHYYQGTSVWGQYAFSNASEAAFPEVPLPGSSSGTRLSRIRQQIVPNLAYQYEPSEEFIRRTEATMRCFCFNTWGRCNSCTCHQFSGNLDCSTWPQDHHCRTESPTVSPDIALVSHRQSLSISGSPFLMKRGIGDKRKEG